MRRLEFSASVVALCFSSRCLPTLPAAALIDEEPEASRRLSELVRGRRPSGWSDAERPSVDALVEELVALRAPYRTAAARGKWRLVYLQPGTEPPQLGLPFNEHYRIFGKSDVISVAELVGPTLEVRAAGAWRDDDPTSQSTPKRFREDIAQGALCAALTMGRAEKANIGRACAPLPLSPRSETYRVVESQYVGARLRIDQDFNSGGTRCVYERVQGFSGR